MPDKACLRKEGWWKQGGEARHPATQQDEGPVRGLGVESRGVREGFVEHSPCIAFQRPHVHPRFSNANHARRVSTGDPLVLS